MYTVAIGRGHVGNKKGARATASIDAKKFSFYTFKTYFFLFYTSIFTKHPIILFILYIYSIKYLFFFTFICLTDLTQPTQPPSSNHPTIVIKPHNNPATIPFNQATINEIHIPIQLSHHHHHHQPTQIQRSKNPFIRKSEGPR